MSIFLILALLSNMLQVLRLFATALGQLCSCGLLVAARRRTKDFPALLKRLATSLKSFSPLRLRRLTCATGRFFKANGAGDCAGLLSVKATQSYSSVDDDLFGPTCPPWRVGLAESLAGCCSNGRSQLEHGHLFSPKRSRLSKTLLHVEEQSASWDLQLLCDQGLLSGYATPKTLIDHL
eukprot:s3053_g6.t1